MSDRIISIGCSEQSLPACRSSTGASLIGGMVCFHGERPPRLGEWFRCWRREACGRKDRSREERIGIVRNIHLFQSWLDLRTFNGGNSVFTKILSPGSLAPFFHEGGLARFVRCCREGPVH